MTGFVERALAFFDEHGIRHLTTQPYRPRTNGKVERFHQTMAREWAYGLAYRSHRQRNQALPHWLDHYNRHRPHSSIGDRPRSAAFTTSVGRTASYTVELNLGVNARLRVAQRAA